MMKPLKVFKVPVHEVAMMMSIALRFIPILLEETDKIIKAQKARGIDFDIVAPDCFYSVESDGASEIYIHKNKL